MRSALIVASMLTGQGASGVETHVNAIVASARDTGLAAPFISAQSDKDWRRRLQGVRRRTVLCFNRELALRVEREADAGQLERNLRLAMAAAGDVALTVYAQDPLSALAALRARGKRRAVRVVMTVHFNESEAQEMVVRGLTRPSGPLWNHLTALEAEVLPKMDHLIFVSAYMRNVLLSRRPGLAKLSSSLIPNFCVPPRAAMQDQALVAGLMGDLVSIGTLEPRKNQQFLLEVLAACNRRGRFYRCTVIGHGPDSGLLQSKAAVLGLTNQVQFLGHRAAAAELISRHRVLVHSANMENMPITLIEALACGRPVMAAAVGGIPEVVEHGVQGFLWPLDDVEAASELLIEVLESPGVWARMSACARLRYETVFSDRVLAGRWLEAIMGDARA